MAPSSGGAEYLKDWLFSITVLHRSHWNASRRYGQVNLWLGVSTSVCAAISGTSAFSSLTGTGASIVTGTLGLIAAILAAVQTSLHASESSAEHKRAAIRFGKLRRELEEQLAVGVPEDVDARTAWLASFRERWDAVDDESPAVPSRFFDQAMRALARHVVTATPKRGDSAP